MAGFKKIVCCTDLSTNADKAFAVASGLAQEWGAQLHVLHVISGGDVIAGSAAETWLPFKESIRERLAEKYPAPQGVAFKIDLREGHAGRVIVDFIKGQHADFVVIGARGQSAMRGLLSGGSVAEKVFNNSPVPVLIIPA